MHLHGTMYGKIQPGFLLRCDMYQWLITFMCLILGSSVQSKILPILIACMLIYHGVIEMLNTHLPRARKMCTESNYMVTWVYTSYHIDLEQSYLYDHIRTRTRRNGNPASQSCTHESFHGNHGYYGAMLHMHGTTHGHTTCQFLHFPSSHIYVP